MSILRFSNVELEEKRGVSLAQGVIMALAKRAGRKVITANQPASCKVFLVMKESRRLGRLIQMRMGLRKSLRTLARLMNIRPCAPTSTTTTFLLGKIRPAKAMRKLSIQGSFGIRPLFRLIQDSLLERNVQYPGKVQVRSDEADGIVCWFVETDYNEESFFVRRAYFLGDKGSV